MTWVRICEKPRELRPPAFRTAASMSVLVAEGRNFTRIGARGPTWLPPGVAVAVDGTAADVAVNGADVRVGDGKKVAVAVGEAAGATTGGPAGGVASWAAGT